MGFAICASSGKVAMVCRKVERFEVVATAGPPGWRLQSLGGASVGPVDEFLLTLAAGGASPTTVRSYAYDLLRWWRWLVASPIGWDVATRTDVRDLVLWMQEPRPGGGGLAAATINHCLAVLSSFYDEHVRAGNVDRSPVPAVGDGRDRHRSPMEPRRLGRRAPLRQRTPPTVPRGLTDTQFTLLFAAMPSDRC